MAYGTERGLVGRSGIEVGACPESLKCWKRCGLEGRAPGIKASGSRLDPSATRFSVAE